jgi:hypothetical protein
MSTYYTELDLAIFKAKRELEAARELVGMSRVELQAICLTLKIKPKRNADHHDLVATILQMTHPHPRIAADQRRDGGQLSFL